ncbi:hypothetical protein DXG03_005931 [Asterophora parasitica]|uniref:WW domain-containing protein n=1 Tax=Asterophora parasitica TaxID=117018 RepID=A0A9P7GDV6_9AGAR|nr:hypothetical protein DXG03_005931 [Asterophora parasitica]
MDDEHEVLDWGNEDDDSKNPDSNRASNQQGMDDLEDAEDAVSLGEDEDEQDYYAYQQEEPSGIALAQGDGLPAEHHSNNGDEEPPSSSRGLRRDDSSTSQIFSSNSGSPRRRHHSSTGRRSPRRSQQPRITHALPPKPVVASVPFLHPSHPSIVEATAMSTKPSVATRASGRSESTKSKINGHAATTVSTTATGKASSAPMDPDPLPRNWELREASSGKGEWYYYNTRTHETTRQSGRTPTQPDPDLIDSRTAIVAPHANGLSYEDRHYRPGEAQNAVVSPTDERRGDRARDDSVDPRFNPHPELAFTPSPPPTRSRKQQRSLSPVTHGRDSRAPRERATRESTDADSSMQRDRDVLQFSKDTLRNHWSQDPVDLPPELNSHNQGSRRQPRSQDGPVYERPPYGGRPPQSTRNGSLRGRREHDQPRDDIEVREENRIQNRSAASTLSASSSHLLHLVSEHGHGSASTSPAEGDVVSAEACARKLGQDSAPSPPPHKRDNGTRDRDDGREPPPSREREQEAPALSAESSALPPQSQRKRERPTRFGQASASISPSIPSATRPQAAGVQIYPHVPMEEDDPFVPDDIRSPPKQELRTRGARGEQEEVTDSIVSRQGNSGDTGGPISSLYPGEGRQAKHRDLDWQYQSPSDQDFSEHAARYRQNAPSAHPPTGPRALPPFPLGADNETQHSYTAGGPPRRTERDPMRGGDRRSAVYPLPPVHTDTTMTVNTAEVPPPRPRKRGKSPIPMHLRNPEGRRDARGGRLGDFRRQASAQASGSNNVPIGNPRNMLGDGGLPGTPGFRNAGPPPPGMGGVNSRPVSLRGRGGAPQSRREFRTRRLTDLEGLKARDHIRVEGKEVLRFVDLELDMDGNFGSFSI